jgi:Cu+-exporting ATPase
LVVDKTGTLTEGKPSVTRIVPAEGYDEATLLRMAGSVERASEHPLALAVVSAAKSRGITLPEATGFDSPTGKGAIGTVEEKHIVLGNARFLAEKGIDASVIEIQANELREEGATAIFVGIDGRLAGVLAIADAIKMTTASAIGRLREEGIRVVMLTGDNRTTAEVVGRRLGIDVLRPRYYPTGKVRLSRASEVRVGSLPWLVMASMTRQRWPRRMSASLWAPARMSLSKVRA